MSESESASRPDHRTEHKVDPADTQAIYKLAMDEGLRRLQHQDEEVAIARTRIMQVMTLVIAATAFLAGTVLRTSDRPIAFYVLAGVATALLLVSVVITYLSIRPIPGWVIETTPQVLIQDYAEAKDPASLADTYKNMAIFYDRYANSNEHSLASLRTLYRTGLLVGGLEVATWVSLAWAVTH